MNKWSVSSLHGKLHIKHGYPFKSEYFSDAGQYIVLTPGNFYEEGGFKRQAGKEKYYLGDIPEDYLHNKGDLIVAMTEQAAGLLGSCAFVPDSGVYLHNQRLGLITTDPDQLSKTFVYYLFQTKSVRDQIRLTSTGSKVKHTSPERIYAVTAPLPKVEVQEEIAAVLSALDAKIDCNNRINAELEAMAKTLYDYWFVQFDFPDANSKPYKSFGGKMVYNATLKREIPEGWGTEPLVQSCEVIDCLHSKKPNSSFEDEGSYLLQLENILNNGQIDLSNKYFVTRSDYKIWTSRIEVREHDVVMTNAGRVAAFAQIPSNVICGIGRNITAIRPKKINPNYFYLCLSGQDIQKQIFANLDQGAFFKSFNVKSIKILNLLRPDSEMEKLFEETVTPLIAKRHEVATENSVLAQLRDWLLPLLMNGQVTAA